ncbi:hypothetical protein GCM10022240_20810 [Microbacterium kribbense]|uniref:DUF2746 domain-containing protein n=1 Tax=Microbacterium kribbense TaxID=433645 RepID=A0ABP7GLQ8_9MICO
MRPATVALSAGVGDNEGVNIVTEPQTWVLLGVFTTIMIGGMTLMTTLLSRTMAGNTVALRAEIGKTGIELSGLRREMNVRFEAVDTKFDAMNARIDHLHHEMDSRFEVLDRDIAALTKRVMG